MRLILTTIILTMLAQPAWAKKVYYCETTAFAQVTQENEVLDIRSYRFKMAVSEDEVKISGGEGKLDFSFDYVKLNLDGVGFLAVRYMFDFPWTLASFRPPRLEVMDLGENLSSFTAHCEDF